MTMLRYDEAELVRSLTRVSVKLRVAFAAVCAERLFPAYQQFCKRASRGDPTALAAILDRIWDHLLGTEMTVEQMRAELDLCMRLIPGEDDEPWVEEQPYADDAASAVAYTLRSLQSGEPSQAALAARRAYEAADHYVMHQLRIEGDLAVLAHPIVQAELARQRRDLDELRWAGQEPEKLIAQLRDRAKHEASIFFDTNRAGGVVGS
jgi:uncharacterized protein YjaG (DUF416 family)